jgi:hypothetical protein
MAAAAAALEVVRNTNYVTSMRLVAEIFRICPAAFTADAVCLRSDLF